MKNSDQAERTPPDFPGAPGAIKSVLIVGAESTIGSGLLNAFSTTGISVRSTSRRHKDAHPQQLLLDLSQAAETWVLPDAPVDVAFLCAAVTSQVQCANEPEATHIINVLRTVELAKKLTEAGTFVIFISTNLVLDGQTPHATVTQARNPQTIYGRQKAEAEQHLLSLGERIAIVRFGKIIAPGLPLFEDWANCLRTGKTIHPFSDLMMAPVALSFAIEVLRRVALAQRPGITQASATDDMSYADAARVIAINMHADQALIAPLPRPSIGQLFSSPHSTFDAEGLTDLGLVAPEPERAFDHFQTDLMHQR